MRTLELDQLVLLPEEQAVQKRFDASNYAVLRWILALATPAALIAALVLLGEDSPRRAALWGVDLLVLLTLYLTRGTRFFERAFRQILVAFLVLQVAIVAVVSPPEAVFGVVGMAFPALLLLFLLRWNEQLSLLGVALGLTVWSLVLGQEPAPATATWLSMSAVAAGWGGVTLWIGSRIRRRRRGEFVQTWRRAVSRSREQSRMREELHDARQIQLSMLPQEPPQVDWVELSAVSIPATEVGGDYYDFVDATEGRLAVVIGDVAGHGMSSGLMLAAVRGGLHLLREELAEPLSAMQRLDRMVREVSPPRMYVTLQVSVLDRAAGGLTVVSAGHPPLLHYRAATGEVVEVGTGSTPLGTRLAPSLEKAEAALSPGDVLLFYSDGAVELVNARGDELAIPGLARSLKRAVSGGSARRIRDRLLDAITFYKGDVALRDDLTLVVARIGERPPLG